MDIGKPQKTIRTNPTIIPVKMPEKKPAERPIPVTNWPTKKTVVVPAVKPR